MLKFQQHKIYFFVFFQWNKLKCSWILKTYHVNLSETNKFNKESYIFTNDFKLIWTCFIFIYVSVILLLI